MEECGPGDIVLRFMKVLLVLLCSSLLGAADFESLPAYQMNNGKLTVTVLKRGGAIGSIVLNSDPQHRSPLWNPAAEARAAGAKNTFGASLGHFPCLDGFGGVSAEESAAGYPSHGELYNSEAAKTASKASKGAGMEALIMSFHLPLANEDVARDYELADGEQVLSVTTDVTSLLAFDRPLQWAEHATIGAPFLKPGATFVDMSAGQSRTRPYTPSTGGLPHRLPSAQDFTWPSAPLLAGGTTNLREIPLNPNSGDHTTQLMRVHAVNFITMLNTEQHLLLGYLFRSDDFPWTQSWEFFPADGQYARGLEFSTQAFDIPRREVVQQTSLFGAPLYRWLPAKSTIRARFLMFLTEVPADFTRVDDVRLDGSEITLEDRSAHRMIRLATKQNL
jgi:hypothetical protein